METGGGLLSKSADTTRDARALKCCYVIEKCAVGIKGDPTIGSSEAKLTTGPNPGHWALAGAVLDNGDPRAEGSKVPNRKH